jgi:hypothetical protein
MNKQMRPDDNDMLEKVCFNCNQFFPYPMYETTANGICLNDEVFEPHIDDIFNDNINPSLKSLLEAKEYPGERESCENFDPVDIEEIDHDPDSPLAQELTHLIDTGQLNKQTIDNAFHNDLKRQVDNIDWKAVPIDSYATQLKSNNSIERDKAISSLSGLIAFGNTDAFDELFNYFINLPSPASIGEVHHKIDLLDKLGHRDKDNDLLPHLIEELYNTPSNNTTRQWISAVFDFIRFFPSEQIREPLEKMLKDQRFSHRLKKKIKEILSR